MELFTITVQIPTPVSEVFNYITDPANFPQWKKEVWIAGRKYGKKGARRRLLQTLYLVNPGQFNMHITGFEQDEYFRLEALKGFPVLPAWSFLFEPCPAGTCLTVISEVNLTSYATNGFLNPQGLSWHWKTFLESLSRELTTRPSLFKTLAFADLPCQPIPAAEGNGNKISINTLFLSMDTLLW